MIYNSWLVLLLMFNIEVKVGFFFDKFGDDSLEKYFMPKFSTSNLINLTNIHNNWLKKAMNMHYVSLHLNIPKKIKLVKIVLKHCLTWFQGLNLSPKVKLHPKSPKVFSNGQTLISLFLMPYRMCRVKLREQGCAKMKVLHFKARVDM
jgi:hypothetical protein